MRELETSTRPLGFVLDHKREGEDDPHTLIVAEHPEENEFRVTLSFPTHPNSREERERGVHGGGGLLSMEVTPEELVTLAQTILARLPPSALERIAEKDEFTTLAEGPMAALEGSTGPEDPEDSKAP